MRNILRHELSLPELNYWLYVLETYNYIQSFATNITITLKVIIVRNWPLFMCVRSCAFVYFYYLLQMPIQLIYSNSGDVLRNINGDSCSAGLDACGSDCDSGCKSFYGAQGPGSCGMCTCFYPCDAQPAPPLPPLAIQI